MSQMTGQKEVLTQISLSEKSTQKMHESYSLALSQAGFSVLTNHHTESIPASLSAMTISSDDIESLTNQCHHLVNALEKVCEARKSQILTRHGLSEIERRYLASLQHRRALATVRVDLFPSQSGFKVLEVNSTIPAMQAYSDMIAESWIKSFDSSYEVRSNSLDLLRSLEHLAMRRTGKVVKKIGIISRKNDSQTSELKWYQKKWRDLGYEVTLGNPSDFSLNNKLMYVSGNEVDVIYRHIFASRLDLDSEFSRALVSGTFAIFNDIAIDLELKNSLVLLRENQSLLTDEERFSVHTLLPWTKEMVEGNTDLLHGKGSLREFVIAFKDDVIIKSSFGYGGKLVFSFDMLQHSEGVQTLKSLTNLNQITWENFVNFCFQSPGRWIVQEKVAGKSIQHSWIKDKTVETSKSWIDLSLFLTLGSDFKTSGGTCRFAQNKVVNIGTGGGMIPLVISPKKAPPEL
jgi:glutathione synthase/RimK-type ligase-like ATP-grasp enzyme